MTEAQQTAAPSRTDGGAMLDRSLLLEYAALDQLYVETKISPEQIKRIEQLSVEIAGPDHRGENVGAVLARRLAETQDLLEGQVNRLIDQAATYFERRKESLRKDAELAIMPSGDAISLGGILEAWTVVEENLEDIVEEGYTAKVGDLVLIYRHSDRVSVISDAEDIAAVRAALHNIGVAINAPTIAGEDRDGDGRTGE